MLPLYEQYEPVVGKDLLQSIEKSVNESSNAPKG
jgi:hypothetical protein